MVNVTRPCSLVKKWSRARWAHCQRGRGYCYLLVLIDRRVGWRRFPCLGTQPSTCWLHSYSSYGDEAAPSQKHHITWYERLPPILWSFNTSVSASTGFSPFFMEHGRAPRDMASGAFDTSDVPAAWLKWVQVMNQRLEMARKVQSAVDTHANDS